MSNKLERYIELFRKNFTFIILSFVSILVVFSGVFLGSYHALAYKSNNPLLGSWKAELFKSSYTFSFNENELTIKTVSLKEGIKAEYTLKMNYRIIRDGRNYSLETFNHTVESNFGLDENEIFKDFPQEYLSRMTDKEKQDYKDNLVSKMKDYKIEDFYRSSIVENPILNYFVKNDNQTLVIGTFLTSDQSLSLEKVKP